MRTFSKTLSLLHRVVAALGVALVLALNLLAVAPGAHALLHEGRQSDSQAACAHRGCAPDTPPPDDDNCVVVKFSQGHGGFAVTPFVVVAAAAPIVVALEAGPRLAVRPPAFLLPPGCGPPAV